MSERKARAEPPVRVIYVMGSGHSGSTILGVTLGNCAGMFYAGELQNYLLRGGMPVLGGLERTRFWAQVRSRVPEAEEIYGPRPHRLLERSSSVLRPRAAAARRRLAPRYRSVTAAVLAAIAEAAGADYVIDSSHFPLRARELQRIPEIELHLLFLVRDPQHVVASITRLVNQHDLARRRLMELKVNADLWLTHALAVDVFLRQPAERRLLVRYEDLLAAPEAVLTRILENSGSEAGLPDLGALQTGVALHANRLIGSEVVAFKRTPPGAGAHRDSSPMTRLMQRPWQAAFARLEPSTAR